MPALDAAPVRLGVGGADAPDRPVADELPRRLLRLAEQRRRRAAQTDAAPRGQLASSRASSGAARRASRCARASRPGERAAVTSACAAAPSGSRRVDRVICQQRIERLVGAAAVGDEARPRDRVRGRSQPANASRGCSRCSRVPRRDVPGGRRARRSCQPLLELRLASRGFVARVVVSGSCSTAIAPA